MLVLYIFCVPMYRNYFKSLSNFNIQCQLTNFKERTSIIKKMFILRVWWLAIWERQRMPTLVTPRRDCASHPHRSFVHVMPTVVQEDYALAT